MERALQAAQSAEERGGWVWLVVAAWCLSLAAEASMVVPALKEV